MIEYLEKFIKRLEEIALRKDIKEMDGIMKSILLEKLRVANMR